MEGRNLHGSRKLSSWIQFVQGGIEAFRCDVRSKVQRYKKGTKVGVVHQYPQTCMYGIHTPTLWIHFEVLSKLMNVLWLVEDRAATSGSTVSFHFRWFKKTLMLTNPLLWCELLRWSPPIFLFVNFSTLYFCSLYLC